MAKEGPEKAKVPDFSATLNQIPKEQQQQVLAIKQHVEAFKNELLKKFEGTLIGVNLLPQLPSQEQQPTGPTIQSTPQPVAQADKNKIRVMVVIDDAETKKQPEELKQQLASVITPMAQQKSKDIVPEVLLISEIWQSCYDGRDDLTKLIAMSIPVYDRGTMAAIKIAEIHRNMVLEQFERYIVSYVLAGSIVQGRSTPESDIDVFIIVDDTDVKKMTRIDLKDRLRDIIIRKGLEAGELTGIRNKLNIQVYILTDFWEYVKDANPIIFTFLRDGAPLYDKGTFMPWKHLLKLGRIKPSQEAIDNYVITGEQVLQRAKLKIREIGMEDTFWSILTPTQAALMLYGVAPPTPKETTDVVRELFVKKEKLLEEKYADILESHIELRKNLEHGTQTKLSGKELDEYLTNCEVYLKRFEKLFAELIERKTKENLVQAYENTMLVIRDVFDVEGIPQPNEVTIEKTIEQELINKGVLPQQYLRVIKSLKKAYQHQKENKATKTEADTARKDATFLIRHLTEHIQRKRLRELGKARLKIKHGKESYGEVVLLGKEAYITHNVGEEKKQISKATITPDGVLKDIQPTTEETLEKALVSIKLPKQTFIKEQIFESLKSIFGKDVEIQVL